MRRVGYGKLLLICFALGFGVFYGMDVVTRGVETVNGPAGGVVKTLSPQPTAKPAVKAATASKNEKGAAVQEPVQQATLHTSFVNRLSNRTGDALRHIATVAMEAVSAFFQGLLE